MPKRKKKKESKQYPVGKEDLRVLPVTPRRRIACALILQSVTVQIQNQLSVEREKAEVKAGRAREASELYSNLVDVQLRALAK